MIPIKLPSLAFDEEPLLATIAPNVSQSHPNIEIMPFCNTKIPITSTPSTRPATPPQSNPGLIKSTSTSMSRKRKTSTQDIQNMQMEVLKLEREKIALELENVRLANKKLELKIKKLE